MDPQEQLVDLLLQEELGGEVAPDVSARVLDRMDRAAADDAARTRTALWIAGGLGAAAAVLLGVLLSRSDSEPAPGGDALANKNSIAIPAAPQRNATGPILEFDCGGGYCGRAIWPEEPQCNN